MKPRPPGPSKLDQFRDHVRAPGRGPRGHSASQRGYEARAVCLATTLATMPVPSSRSPRKSWWRSARSSSRQRRRGHDRASAVLDRLVCGKRVRALEHVGCALYEITTRSNKARAVRPAPTQDYRVAAEIPPHSAELERAILGAVLQEPETRGRESAAPSPWFHPHACYQVPREDWTFLANSARIVSAFFLMMG